jgi:hypothetical protein
MKRLGFKRNEPSGQIATPKLIAGNYGDEFLEFLCHSNSPASANGSAVLLSSWHKAILGPVGFWNCCEVICWIGNLHPGVSSSGSCRMMDCQTESLIDNAYQPMSALGTTQWKDW